MSEQELPMGFITVDQPLDEAMQERARQMTSERRARMAKLFGDRVADEVGETLKIWSTRG